MSEFHIRVVRLGAPRPHPNADRIEIFDIDGGYPVIRQKGLSKEGDKAVYVPVDAIVPVDDPRWDFLKGSGRTKWNLIRAIKLRGVFSMGILTEADPSWEVGQNVQEELRITKYEPEEIIHWGKFGGENPQHEKDPGTIPVYTDIEGLRRYRDVLAPGELVVLTEKLHGSNGRFGFHDGKLYCGSHRKFWKDDHSCIWWAVARQYGLTEKPEFLTRYRLYGEVIGLVQKGFSYGVSPEKRVDFRAFDIFDTETDRYVDYDDFIMLCKEEGFPMVPVLGVREWNHEEAKKLAEGKTVVEGADHIREGFVVRPVRERWEDRVGRVIFKMIGEGYLLAK